MNRLIWLIALLAGLGLWGLTGCTNDASDNASDAGSSQPSVTIIDPPLPHQHRFRDLVLATTDGLDHVDLDRFEGSVQEMNYAIYAEDYDRYWIEFAIGQKRSQFCATDSDQDVWYTSLAEQKSGRMVFAMGDGDECSLDPADAVGFATLTPKAGLKHLKGTTATRALINAALTPAQP